MIRRRKRGMVLKAIIEHYSIPITECGCWFWLNALNHDGYGAIHYHGKGWPAHRASWLAHFGAIPRAMSVLHKCDIPCCVNPDHLFIGTQADNVADCTVKGRHKNPRFVGEAHPMAKLSNEDNLAIRASTKTQYELAAEYGISQSRVSIIRSGKRYGVPT